MRGKQRWGLAGLLVLVMTSLPASAATYTEKAINLDIAKRVERALEDERVSVRMTRSSDRTVSPSARTGLANRLDVDAFVSIHNNASSNRSAAGSIVFHSIRKDGSKDLGDAIRDGLRAELGSDRRSALATRRGCCGDYYFQLRQTRMTAVLVEGAFLTNPDEGKRLATSSSYRQRIADAIVSGILRYQRGLVARRAPSYDPGLRVPGPFVPPTQGRSDALGAHRVALEWHHNPNVAAYRVYRDGRLIARHRVAADAGVVRLTDVWAAPGQTYTYEIRGYDKIADGVYAESAPLTLTARTPAISVVLDAGHGGRDPGAVVRY